MKRVFVAMPVSDNLASDGRFRAERRQFFESLVKILEAMGWDVASAGTNENWGAVKLTPIEFTLYDIDALAAADCLVIITNERLNRDMYLEMGLAAARRIPIIAIVPASTKLTYMAIGLEELGLLTVRRYDSEAEAPDLLRSAVSDLSDPELALAAD
jgi:nucleoside 2-deoxyribosyltransferase